MDGLVVGRITVVRIGFAGGGGYGERCCVAVSNGSDITNGIGRDFALTRRIGAIGEENLVAAWVGARKVGYLATMRRLDDGSSSSNRRCGWCSCLRLWSVAWRSMTGAPRHLAKHDELIFLTQCESGFDDLKRAARWGPRFVWEALPGLFVGGFPTEPSRSGYGRRQREKKPTLQFRLVCGRLLSIKQLTQQNKQRQEGARARADAGPRPGHVVCVSPQWQRLATANLATSAHTHVGVAVALGSWRKGAKKEDLDRNKGATSAAPGRAHRPLRRGVRRR